MKFMAARLACMAALALGACAGGENAPPQPIDANEIVIGVAGPMSGQLAAFGKEARLGAETAVADINAKGGVLGKKLRLMDGDDRCDPKRAVEVANDLIRQHAVFVVGHFCSGSSIPAAQVYADAGVVQMTPASTNPALTERAAADGIRTVFRATNRDDWQGSFAGDYLARNFRGKKLAVLDDGSGYGRGVAERVAASAAQGGLPTTLCYTYRPRIEDFSVLVPKLAGAGIDLVYVGGFHDDVAWLMKQAQSQNFRARFFSDDALNTQDFWKLAGEAGAGLMFTDAAVHLDEPAAQAAVKALRDGGDLNDAYNMNYALNAYAAVQAFAGAASATGTTDAKEVAGWLHQNRVPTAIGEVSWDGKGDLSRPNYAWYIWRNGRYAPAPE